MTRIASGVEGGVGTTYAAAAVGSAVVADAVGCRRRRSGKIDCAIVQERRVLLLLGLILLLRVGSEVRIAIFRGVSRI